MNIVILQGRVGRDAEHKPDVGNGLATFSLATSESFKDKAGEWKEVTDWHNIVVWGPLAAKVVAIARKGALVCVTGTLKSRNYTDKNDIKRTVVEVSAKTVHGLVVPAKPQENEDAEPPSTFKKPATPDLDDEIPF